MRRLAALSSVVVLLFSQALPTLAGGVDHTAEVSFRDMLGFSTDEALLDSLAMDSSAIDTRFGMPFTASERAELDRRMFVQQNKGELHRHLMGLPMFGGMWTDQRGGGVLIINFADRPESHADTIAEFAPDGAIYELRRVGHPLAELLAVQGQILEEAAELEGRFGIRIGYVNVDVETNRVQIGLVGPSRALEMEMDERFGTAVAFVPSGGGSTTACSSRSNCPGPPLRAGISGSYGCSVAFVGYVSTAYYMYTAGHCAANGSAWSHNGKSLGTMTRNTYANNSTADAAMVGPIGQNDIQRWLYKTNTTVIVITSRQAYWEDAKNDVVCLSARKAEAVRCGLIESTNQAITYQDGTRLTNQRWAHYAWQSGDSGGAVYASSKALGIQSGCLDVTGDGQCDANQAIYSHIHYVQSKTGGWVNVSNCGNWC